MDFWRTLVVLFRRWYITVPAFFMTLGLAGAAYSVVPVKYQSNAVLVLTTPLSGGTQATHAKYPNSLTNPLMNFDRSLALSAAIIIQQMNSSETMHALGLAPGSAISYQVSNGSTNPELLESGPFLFVQGVGPSPLSAQAIAEKASAMAAGVLSQRQTELNAPPSTHIGLQVVVPPTAGQPLMGSALRAAAAAGVLAGLASLAAVYGFESLMTHRRRRRAAKGRAALRDDSIPPTTGDAAEGLGITAVRVLPGRSRHPYPADSARLVHEDVPKVVGPRVNGTSTKAATISAVGLLDSPDSDDNRADRPDQDPGSEER